jgi:hypothetical protein
LRNIAAKSTFICMSSVEESNPARAANAGRVRPLHVRLPEQAAVMQIGVHEVDRIGTPEQFSIDLEGRHAPHAGGSRRRRRILQALLDGRVLDQRRVGRDAEARAQCGPLGIRSRPSPQMKS